MFPLGTVLLPHMVLPLHVFEERYRALMRDVVSDGHSFGVVLIARGHEVGGGDQRFDVGCVAEVARAEELDDGRWLVIAVGTHRIRVRRWLPEEPYPRASVDVLADGAPPPPGTARNRLGAALDRVLTLEADLSGEATTPFDLREDSVLATWQAAIAAPLTPLDRQRVLECAESDERLRLVEVLLAEVEEVLEFRVRNR